MYFGVYREVTFPFLFGGTFIEGARATDTLAGLVEYFPSFSEGLSLRGTDQSRLQTDQRFPFLFGGTFIEGLLSGGTFCR